MIVMRTKSYLIVNRVSFRITSCFLILKKYLDLREISD